MGNEESTNLLPSVNAIGDTPGVFAALLKMSKQGKLAGYEHSSGALSAIADAHGTPFDSDLVIQHDGGQLRFSLTMRRKMPVIFALLLIVSVWPGLPLTDTFMFGFGWYERLMGDNIQTWMWYLPMTVLPTPFVWRSVMMKSQASAHEHALETIEKIKSVIGS